MSAENSIYANVKCMRQAMKIDARKMTENFPGPAY